jgi:hypothetical protein
MRVCVRARNADNRGPYTPYTPASPSTAELGDGGAKTKPEGIHAGTPSGQTKGGSCYDKRCQQNTTGHIIATRSGDQLRFEGRVQQPRYGAVFFDVFLARLRPDADVPHTLRERRGRVGVSRPPSPRQSQLRRAGKLGHSVLSTRQHAAAVTSLGRGLGPRLQPPCNAN